MTLKRLLIIGNDLLPEDSEQFKQIKKSHSTPDSLIIRHMDASDWTNLADKLEIDDKTRIDIHAHGMGVPQTYAFGLATYDEYGLSLGRSGDDLYTFEYIFSKLKKISNNQPLHVHIWSCFSGNAHKDITFLPENSILFTHTPEDLTSKGILCESSLIQSIRDWNNYETLSSNKSIRSLALQAFLNNFALETFERASVSTCNYKNPYLFWKKQKVTKYEFTYTEDSLKNPKEVLEREGKKFSKFCDRILLIGEKLNYPKFTEEQEKILQHGYLIKNLLDKPEESMKLLKELDLPLSFFEEFTGANYYQIAFLTQNIELIKYFIEKGWDLNQHINTSTPLHIAIVSGTGQIRKLLNTHKLDSALVQDAILQQKDIIELLLKNGADPNKSSEAQSPLAAAMLEFNPNKEVIKLLIKYGADTSESLLQAILFREVKKVDLLLDSGANPNQNIHGKSVLEYSILLDCEEIMSLLLERGADTHDPLNMDAFLKTIINGNLKIVKLLLESGVNLNKILGEIAIIAAVSSKNLDMVELLFEYKINLNDSLKSKVLEIALGNKDLDMIKLFVKHKIEVEKALEFAKSSFIKSDALNQIVEFLESKLELEESLTEHTESVDTAPVGESEIHNDAIGS